MSLHILLQQAGPEKDLPPIFLGFPQGLGLEKNMGGINPE